MTGQKICSEQILFHIKKLKQRNRIKKHKGSPALADEL